MESGMTAPISPGTVTDLLNAWARGERQALETLVPLVYEELRRIAGRYMRRERAGATLQTSALVNEAYMRLVKANAIPWQDRTHFFAVSAQIMRRILVDAARHRRYAKRGGGAYRVSIDEGRIGSTEQGAVLEALDDALTALARFDPRKAQVVEMRFFGGLSVEETAKVLLVSPPTVLRDWKLAKVWLTRELDRTNGHES